VLVNLPGGVELAVAWVNQPDFKVELVTVTPRTHYRVTVTPPEEAKLTAGVDSIARGRSGAGRDGAHVLCAGEVKVRANFNHGWTRMNADSKK
jgi:hypothetical protein